MFNSKTISLQWIALLDMLQDNWYLAFPQACLSMQTVLWIFKGNNSSAAHILLQDQILSGACSTVQIHTYALSTISDSKEFRFATSPWLEVSRFPNLKKEVHV